MANIENIKNCVDELCTMLMKTYDNVKIVHQLSVDDLNAGWDFIIKIDNQRWWFHASYSYIVDLLEAGLFLIWLDGKVQECMRRMKGEGEQS